MTSIAIPPTSHNLLLPNPNPSSPLKIPYLYPSSPPISHSLFTSQHSHSNTLSRVCRCQNSSSSSSSSDWNWGASLHGLGDAIKFAFQRLNSQLKRFHNDSNSPTVTESNFSPNSSPDEFDWDWDRWRQHFNDVDEQERLLSVLKSQLGHAVQKEHFEDAARLKVAIAAAASNDTVGIVMSKLNRAIEEERYQDAAFMRDNAGAGLVGWWSGISENTNDPQGLIVRITAEHGRYVARSYTPRQLATAATGAPLFEIFLTVSEKGEYRQQAVYLKRGGIFQDSSAFSKVSESTSSLDPLDSSEDKGDLLVAVEEDTEGEGEGDDDRDDESDSVEAFSGFQNILKDMIPGVKVKVLKVTAPGKVDRDLISKVIEQIIEEDDEEKDDEIDNSEVEDEIKSESDLESDQERDAIEFNDRHEIIESEGQNEIKVKVVIGGVMQKISNNLPTRDMLRTPAKLKKRGRLSFSFIVDNDVNQQEYNDRTQASFDRQTELRGQRSIEHIMLDLTRFIGRDKIPQKVLKDIGEMINLTLNQARNHQPLSRLTKFNRIELASSSDPLNGLYIGAHGLYTSEIIQLKRKFGQWKEDNGTKVPSNLEFYEYVEATKITGDPYVPAGQVAFRAKVGKGYQLPHKGIIPEEFGVIARYKGQGRLASPGFHNPRWVDGELVILDGKYIKGGPVVGFVYWAPEYHFLVFFNRLRLQE